MYDKTRKPRPNARGRRLPTMHPFTVVYTERWVLDDFRKAWLKRHAQPGEPSWSARLASVRSSIHGALGLLREIERNKAWWNKPKRTHREKAVAQSATDINRYFELTRVRVSQGWMVQPLDDLAFRALQSGKPEAIEALKILEAITVDESEMV